MARVKAWRLIDGMSYVWNSKKIDLAGFQSEERQVMSNDAGNIDWGQIAKSFKS